MATSFGSGGLITDDAAFSEWVTNVRFTNACRRINAWADADPTRTTRHFRSPILGMYSCALVERGFVLATGRSDVSPQDAIVSAADALEHMGLS